MITEEEAKLSATALVTAMLSDDKESREAIYAGYDEESLKRVLRWVCRLHWPYILTVANLQNMTPLQIWAITALRVQEGL